VAFRDPRAGAGPGTSGRVARFSEIIGRWMGFGFGLGIGTVSVVRHSRMFHPRDQDFLFASEAVTPIPI